MTLAEIQGRFGRYFLTGGLAAILEYLLFLGLVRLVQPVFLAALIAIAIALAANYLLAARFAFRVKGSKGKAGLFAIGAVIGLNLNAGTTALAESHELIGPGLAKIIGTGTAFVFNFLYNNFIVFPAQAAAHPPEAQGPAAPLKRP
ncbi:MAG: GtrA family protein [Mangrovicoccus sp.]|nr:GtrA family protein [Mangrovicoccus sp.]